MQYSDQMRQSIRESVQKSCFDDERINTLAQQGDAKLGKVLKRAIELKQGAGSDADKVRARFIVMQIQTFQKILKKQ